MTMSRIRRFAMTAFVGVLLATLAASCGSAAKAERHISVFVEGALSTALLEAEISPGDTAVCSFENGAYKFIKVGQ